MAVVFSIMLRMIAILLCVTSLAAQERTFRRYTVEDGLSQNSVYAIAQDTSGFMWFGTADGVNRFDGYSFTQFRPVPDDPSSIPSTFTRQIYRAPKGDLLFGHFDGFSFYQQDSNRFRRIPLYLEGTRTLDVYGIRIDRSGTIWCVSPAGVFRMQLPDSTLTPVPVVTHNGTPVTSPHAFSLTIDRKGRIWLAANEGLFLFNEQADEFRGIALVDAIDDACRSVVEDVQGNIWVGTGKGSVFSFAPDLTRLQNHSKDLFGPNPKQENLITQMMFDRSGRLWIATYEQGLYEFSPAKRTLHHYRHDIADPGSIAFDIIRSLYIDSNDNLWVGTDGGGICVTPLFPKEFHLITNRPGKKPLLSDTFVKGICQDRQGIIWIGTAKGLNRYDPIRDSCTLFVPYPEKTDAVSNQVFTITEDRRGTLWVSTAYGICSFDTRTGIFHPYPGLEAFIGMVLPTVFFHTVQDDSLLWIGTLSIIVFNTRTGHYRRPEFISGHFSQRQTLIQYWDSSGSLWIGTSKDGVFRYNSHTGVWTDFHPVDHDTNSLSASGIRCIFEERRGRIWIGTVNGLNLFDEGTGSITRYFEKDGLPNAFVYSVLPDDRGNLWLSTNRGLSRFDPSAGRFRNFTVQDGLQSAEFNTGAYHRNERNGWLFFGGVNGVTYFHPDSIVDSQFSPPIVLTELKKFDRPLISPVPFHSIRELMLPYNENTITFSYAAMDFSNPQQVRYSYRLEGFEPDWIQSGTRRDVRYTNLSPGAYTFRVRATNADGVMGSNELAVRLIIVPPFWATAWFRILAVMTLIGMIAAVVRFIASRKFRRQIEVLEQQKRILEERQRTRDKIARDLHDDLASTVGSAGLFVETARRTIADDPQQSKEFLVKASSILTEAEESMSDIVWSVSPKHDTLQGLVTRIRAVTTDLCRAEGIASTVTADGELTAPLSDEVRRGFYLIFKEVLNNILKHAHAAAVDVRISIDPKALTMTISDNGRGFIVDGQRDGLGGNGVLNIRKRAAEMRAVADITSAPGQGTAVAVKLELTQLGH